jgi:uncharacterized Zn finger protein
MSPWTPGRWPQSSRPIAVEGGVLARSKRGAIGEQWWSRRFIDVLESWGMSGRLSRGRNYARRGQVLGFEVTTGYVTAQVQGSLPEPYVVRIQVLPLTERQWDRVEQALAARAVFRARLLAGEMPAEIEQIFADCGTPLFPRSPGDLEMTCSCPDWGKPCKHQAAVCYVLAESFDEDPFAVLAWRGRGREKLLASLRRIATAGSSPAGSGPAGARPAGFGPPGTRAAGPGSAGGDAPRPVIEVADRPLAQCLDDFWSAGLSAVRLRAMPAAPATAPDLLLRSFEPPAVAVRGQDLADLLAPAYRRLAETDDVLEGDADG